MNSGTTDAELQQLSSAAAAAGCDTMPNIAGELFELLKKIGSTVLMAENFHHGVVVHFVSLLERCAAKEAFSPQQKASMQGWIQRLKTVWNPSMRRKSMVSMDSKRK